jgi:diguanylate cyclase (GGDEF)-like protein
VDAQRRDDEPFHALAVAWGRWREGLRALFDDVVEVTIVSTPEEALTRLRMAPVDLVVLALPLEHGEAIPTLQRFKADPVAVDVPVAVLSPDREEELAVRCLDLGAEFMWEGSGTEARARLARALRGARRERSLAKLAQVDALTGLSNFGALRDRLDDEFKRANRYEYPLSAVMIDLDHLKRINDRFGHEIGNRAIVALAAHLKDNLRETDFAARFGGDEFVLLLPYQNPSEATVLVERLRESLKALRVPAEAGACLELSISAGIAGHSALVPCRDARALLLAADEALYEAKRAGRDRVVSFEAARTGPTPPPATAVASHAA